MKKVIGVLFLLFVSVTIADEPPRLDEVTTVQAPTPVAETPVPVAETPVPVAETPVPVAETPVPVVETPVPVVETPVPVVETPVSTPAAKTPAAKTPAAKTPAAKTSAAKTSAATPTVTENSVFIIICDEKPGQAFVLGSTGKWLSTVRDVTISFSIGQKVPSVICTLWSGPFKPSNPEVKAFELMQLKSVTNDEFQLMIDLLQTDPDAISRQIIE